MKKLLTSALVLATVITLSGFMAVTPAFAITDDASSVSDFNQGLQKGGGTVDAARSDPNNALGASNGVFVSLGFGGDITLEFPVSGTGNLSVSAYEVTGGPYPEETANVEVSADGLNWTLLGTASNELGEEDGITTLPVNEGCVRFVRLTDTTNPDLHGNTADAFDVDAVSLDYDSECPAPEPEPEPCDQCEAGDDTVINKNYAFVVNQVEAEAETGENYAGGSSGGNGGNGGNIEAKGNDAEVEGSTTGNGGAGGAGSDGGLITTGTATALAGAVNIVNTSRTVIDRCACDNGDCDEGDVKVINRSVSRTFNKVEAEAETGDNTADGSSGGTGGNGGNIKADGNGDEAEVEDSTTGSGGAGAPGGLGGEILTGDATAKAGVVNIIGRNRTLIRR